ncbi:HPr family phosphocarrier protein [Paramaledivibacter caminithermalis]|uniref:Phosphocarrier protein HPr n=1 Tax=Paramaledivibacter caminithermalis (strain DSM 15212 / CIP 107654 / DViRD3) TaxID=1121301 RepID=A0A1M6KUP5_PARC5|nr:HPr family phosphocarrier protein [Paramaledivibacter caminithermalis]SHJ62653.1 phosphocarrier protein [Paramaledivibacter caminithermalis DSM 15212]
MKKNVKIINESGLHARPAAVFVKSASQFKSDINIELNGSIFNAKSIMNILSLGAKKGDEITIVADGPDEKEAIDCLVNLIESKFGEE